MKSSILVVDDERLIRWSFEKRLQKEDWQVFTASTVKETRKVIIHEEPDVLILDIHLPDGSTLAMIPWIRQAYPDIQILMMTAQGSIESAVSAMKQGVLDYLTKPVDLEDLVQKVKKALELKDLRQKVALLSKKKREAVTFIAQSPQMLEVLQLAHTAAEREVRTVLLYGESGVGKEVVAHYIHQHSPRAQKPFIAINCGAVPENLLESELFGYERGAFTDAKSQKKGILELANGGVVLLDEVGDMQKNIQVKLLRVLEEWKVRRLGGVRDLDIDVMLIASTNQDLQSAVDEGAFRTDLFYRLNVFPIHIPPLRERREDILPLAKAFLAIFNQRFRREIVGFTPALEEAMLTYPWPGNVRELKNAIERGVILCQQDLLDLAHVFFEEPKEERWGKTLDMEENEKQLIQEALRRSKGNISQAAKLLNISRDKLRYKLKKYNLR